MENLNKRRIKFISNIGVKVHNLLQNLDLQISNPNRLDNNLRDSNRNRTSSIIENPKKVTSKKISKQNFKLSSDSFKQFSLSQYSHFDELAIERCNVGNAKITREQIKKQRKSKDNQLKSMIFEISKKLKTIVSENEEYENQNETSENKKNLNKLIKRTFHELKNSNELQKNIFSNLINPQDNRKLIKIAKIFQHSESDESHEDQIFNVEESYFIISYDCLFKQIWDCLSFIFILYTIIFSPIMIVFNNEGKLYLIPEYIIECFNILDIILKFFTSIQDEGENTINEINRIFWHYIENEFFLDLICSFPGYFTYSIIKIEDYSNNLFKLKLLQWTIIMRVFKIRKFEVLNQIIERISLKMRISYIRILKIFFFFFCFIHVFSCFFSYLALFNGNIDNWMNLTNVSSSGGLDQYICSVYYSLVTIFTVGYGDIFPVNFTEKIVIIIFLFFGNLYFSYIISAVSTLFSNKNHSYIEFKKKINILNKIKREYSLEGKLITKIEIFLKNDFSHKKLEIFDLISSLPGSLQNELTIIMYKEKIKGTQFFECQNQNFILTVVPLLKSANFTREESIVSCGEILDEMYLLTKGVLSFHLESYNNSLEIGELVKNNHFGELLMQFNIPCPFQIMCKTKESQTFIISKLDFFKIKESFFEITGEILEKGFIFLENLHKRKDVYIQIIQKFGNLCDVKKMLEELKVHLQNSESNKCFEPIDINKFFIDHKFDEIQNVIKSLKCMKSNVNNIVNDKFINKKNNAESVKIRSNTTIKPNQKEESILLKLNESHSNHLLINENIDLTKNITEIESPKILRKTQKTQISSNTVLNEENNPFSNLLLEKKANKLNFFTPKTKHLQMTYKKRNTRLYQDTYKRLSIFANESNKKIYELKENLLKEKTSKLLSSILTVDNFNRNKRLQEKKSSKMDSQYSKLNLSRNNDELIKPEKLKINKICAIDSFSFNNSSSTINPGGKKFFQVFSRLENEIKAFLVVLEKLKETQFPEMNENYDLTLSYSNLKKISIEFISEIQCFIKSNKIVLDLYYKNGDIIFKSSTHTIIQLENEVLEIERMSKILNFLKNKTL